MSHGQKAAPGRGEQSGSSPQNVTRTRSYPSIGGAGDKLRVLVALGACASGTLAGSENAPNVSYLASNTCSTNPKISIFGVTPYFVFRFTTAQRQLRFRVCLVAKQELTAGDAAVSPIRRASSPPPRTCVAAELSRVPPPSQAAERGADDVDGRQFDHQWFGGSRHSPDGTHRDRPRDASCQARAGVSRSFRFTRENAIGNGAARLRMSLDATHGQARHHVTAQRVINRDGRYRIHQSDRHHVIPRRLIAVEELVDADRHRHAAGR